MIQWDEYIYQCRSFQKQVTAEKKKATLLHSIIYACRVSLTDSVSQYQDSFRPSYLQTSVCLKLLMHYLHTVNQHRTYTKKGA